MGKIINTQTNKIIYSDDQYGLGTVIDYLENKTEEFYSCDEYERLSQLIETMTGDAVTTFNTIGEMIKDIPEIVNCGEECGFLCVCSPVGIHWFVLGWNYGDDEKLNNKILQTYFPELKVVEN